MRRSQPWLTNRSRVLRAADIPAERRLWSELRNRRLCGIKFVRQEPIGNFFADFVCRERKLVVEVDGGTHGQRCEIRQDAVRDAFFRGEGYQVLRVGNEDVAANLTGVLETIMSVLNEVAVSADAAPHPSPLPAGGEREKRFK